MKKTFLYGAMLLSLSLAGQQQQQQQKICGFDQELELQDRTNPGMRKVFDKIIKNIQEERKANPLSTANKTVNGVYEIPVVVHVIEGNNSAYTRTYEQIQQWLDKANQMYAGTYPWPANGVPADFGTSAVFPIKLVLAKRDPNCNATTGVVRYNGGTLNGYNTYGMAYQQNVNGASRNAIKALAPHWPEASYFNIYVITTFDGETTPNAGLMGFAAFPNNFDANYESFMKTGVVTNPHDTTFAHEFGHAMGLYHTFQGGTYDAVPTDPDFCPPTTGDCTEDDDQVCDTERSGSGYAAWPVPSNTAMNSCTGANYQGVQYNMMNYSNSLAQKFTAGQGERINDLFMLFRSSLTTSKGATELPSTPAPSVVPTTVCLPAGLQNPANFLVGPVSVKLGQIDNASPGYWQAHPLYYVDYTTKACSLKTYTSLVVNQPQTIDVGIFGNPQSVRVWIDYNNNGTFETNELVASGDDVAIGTDDKGTFTGTFTPPATATLNTPLRMRVIADAESPSAYAACGQLGYGQAEDYSVMLVTSLGTSEVKADNNDLVIYPNPVATGDKVFIKAKNAKNLKVSISDMSGRLMASPSVSDEGNGIYKIDQQLEKGVYMIQVSNGKESKTSKLIIK